MLLEGNYLSRLKNSIQKNPASTEVIMGLFSLYLVRFFTGQMVEIQSTYPANNCKNETCRHCRYGFRSLKIQFKCLTLYFFLIKTRNMFSNVSFVVDFKKSNEIKFTQHYSSGLFLLWIQGYSRNYGVCWFHSFLSTVKSILLWILYKNRGLSLFLWTVYNFSRHFYLF